MSEPAAGKEHGTPTLRGTADMYVGMSELECEYNDLNAATQHLLRSQEQGEHTGFPQYRYRWRVAMARIRQAPGRSATAPSTCSRGRAPVCE